MSISLAHEVMSCKGRAQAIRIAEKVVNGTYSLEELMNMFFSDEKMVCQRASWPIAMISDIAPQKLNAYLDKMILNLENPAHDAVVRNTVRAFQTMQIPEEYEGQIFEICFNYLNNPKYPVAIRVFAMTVCTNLCEKFPELAPEVATVIEDYWHQSTAGWRSRGKRELKRLSKFRAI